MVINFFKVFLIFVLILHKSLCLGQNYNDIIISEIMADPTPGIALPDVEYIELYNRSDKPVQLKNWILVVGTRISTFPDSIILPGMFIIVCSQASYNSMKNYGKVVGINALSLPNEAAIISLFSPSKKIIFSISYNLKLWVSDKNSGGYSIEMSDLKNPCIENDNWKTSEDSSGGTPGKENSVKENKRDNSPPEIERIDVISPTELRIIAAEKLDSVNAVSGALIEVEGRVILNKKLELPTFRNLVLKLSSPLVSGKNYAVSLRNLADCSGNILRKIDFNIELPIKADSGDIVLNEILFNPPANGVDFVEIYNNSGRFVSLNNWSIGNTKNGLPDIFRIITTENVILAPYNYLALSTDVRQTKDSYPTDKVRNFLQVDALPSFANASGSVILRNDSNTIFDRFDYSETMHDPLISNPKGVSLEKENFLISSQIPQNWHSAASATGNATPGYANSQIEQKTDEPIFTVEPEAFVANNNGLDDFAKIKYQLQVTGTYVTIRIYDIAGRLIKNLIRNQLIGTYGEISWDGTNENGITVDTGYYLILIDTFDANGQTNQFKLKVVAVKK
ncbi:Lamin Tail Domain [Dyadobacter koreensis]|uniref:Lamin Tail Domain n=1 Tax=Dyadobacter koreensis TaxID=408657 RepID=A0A1H6U755_9BACT|nr:lamin tail domain-containing protein [Dyadobacter koreensis]SEI83712.1 Lamin Tail Domain [Dyadobacter koreensis]